MRNAFRPALLHPAGGDPGLWVDLPDAGRAVLFDAPELAHVPARLLLRVAHAVVTHTHMDHYVGFDHLLRVALRREEPLTITGPEGFLDSVRGRIAAYAWNLISSYPVRLRVQEVAAGVLRHEDYSAASGMRPAERSERAFDGTAHAERAFRVDVAVLDHGMPVLGAAVRESEHLSVDRDRLVHLGFAIGPWLAELKDAVRRGAPADTPVLAARAHGGTESIALGEIAPEVILRGPGRSLVYLTDLSPTADNLVRAAAFAAGADLLVCEAAFLEEDRDLAAERHHLTARHAGELARRAGAARLAIFHVSPRYEGRLDQAGAEAGEAFGRPVLELPRLPAATIRA